MLLFYENNLLPGLGVDPQKINPTEEAQKVRDAFIQKNAANIPRMTTNDYKTLTQKADKIFKIEEGRHSTIKENAFKMIDEKEVLKFLKTRQGELDGVCITGGEPTMQKDLAEICGVKWIGK